MATKKSSTLTVKQIKLTLDELNVLSVVAEQAGFAGLKPANILDEFDFPTDRARKIGQILMGKKVTAPPSYRVMAKLFQTANKSDLKYARILKGHTPKGLWVDRGL